MSDSMLEDDSAELFDELFHKTKKAADEVSECLKTLAEEGTSQYRRSKGLQITGKSLGAIGNFVIAILSKLVVYCQSAYSSKGGEHEKQK